MNQQQSNHGMYFSEGASVSIVLTTPSSSRLPTSGGPVGASWSGTVDGTDAAGLYIVTNPGSKKAFFPWSSIASVTFA